MSTKNKIQAFMFNERLTNVCVHVTTVTITATKI